MSERGVPEQVEAQVCAALDGWRAFEDPSHRQFAERAIGVTGPVMTAFLDGMRARGDEPVLVLAASYPPQLSSFTGLADVQWDIFPTADCTLRSAERRGQAVDARVAIVPRLWVEALADPRGPSRDGEFVVLGDVSRLQDHQRVSSAVAAEIKKSGTADVLDCRRWNLEVPRRMSLERSAREATERALTRLWQRRLT